MKKLFWRFLILIYAPFVYLMELIDFIFDPDYTFSVRERSKITILMYWYKY